MKYRITAKELRILIDALSERGVELTELSPKERKELDQKWNVTFASQVKKQQGVYVYRGFRWHAYSYEIVPCLQGEAALKEYLAQARAPYYLFDESMDICGLCKAGRYLDLTWIGDDVYVVHHKLRWSMAFTHEQPYLGPFFARAPHIPDPR